MRDGLREGIVLIGTPPEAIHIARALVERAITVSALTALAGARPASMRSPASTPSRLWRRA